MWQLSLCGSSVLAAADTSTRWIKARSDMPTHAPSSSLLRRITDFLQARLQLLLSRPSLHGTDKSCCVILWAGASWRSFLLLLWLIMSSSCSPAVQRWQHNDSSKEGCLPPGNSWDFKWKIRTWRVRWYLKPSLWSLYLFTWMENSQVARISCSSRNSTGW